MLYSLRVIQDGRAPFELKIDATSIMDARLRAEQQGLKVLKVRSSGSFFSGQNKQFPLMLFCQEFRVLLEAGLSMTDVLDTLIQKEVNSANKSNLQRLLTNVREGKTLSQSMSECSNIFPNLLIATVATAERTGNLPEALARYIQYSENVDLLKKRIISASIYPAIVVSFGILVFGFLLFYVIPKFGKIYESQVKGVTGSTQMLLDIAHFSDKYAYALLILMISTTIIMIWAFMQPSTRSKCYEWLWKLPYMGQKVRLYHLARFYRTFAMLLKSGLTVTTSLGMVSGMLGVGLQANLLNAKRLIVEGKPLSEAFENSQLITPVALRLFKVGEKTGALEQMMEHAASFHEDQMIRWVDKVTKILEPTLMAVIGLLIGGLVLMMYLPIFDLASGLE